MKSSVIETPAGISPTNHAGDEVIEKLTARVSELEEANANLQLLDEAMKRNNALFEAVLANSWQGITLTGPDRRILKVVRGLTGRPAGELQGLLVESVAVPEDQDIIIEAYHKLLRRECAKVTIEFRVHRVDGTIAWFSAAVTDMLDDPNVQCIVWNYTDITKEKKAAAPLAPIEPRWLRRGRLRPWTYRPAVDSQPACGFLVRPKPAIDQHRIAWCHLVGHQLTLAETGEKGFVLAPSAIGNRPAMDAVFHAEGQRSGPMPREQQ